MKGLKPHSHQARQEVIDELIPLVKKKFGSNLIALAATASYARNEDRDYSDLELTAFVETMPEGRLWDGIGKIRNGLLVELIWTTRENYLQNTLDVTANWYLAGSDILLPIINEKFIRELQSYRVKELHRKCLERAVKHWHEVQEATAKVLNAVIQNNREGIPLLFFDMLRNMLIVLSFLNQTPYKTFADFIAQAKRFEIKPATFAELTEIAVEGGYRDLAALERTVIRVFTEFETIYENLGVQLYDADLNLG